ncbi:MAG: MazG-like family protein [Planctomycetota bacterium]
MSDKASLDFDTLRQANVARCEDVFHPLAEWSLSDWGVAMAGEAGEACNVIKKIRRGDHPFQFDVDEVLGDELADVVLQLDLLAARAGIDLGEAVRRKFNVVSDRRHSDIRL